MGQPPHKFWSGPRKHGLYLPLYMTQTLHTCRTCGRLFPRPGERGPIPKKCGRCDPEIREFVQQVLTNWENLDDHYVRILYVAAQTMYDIKRTTAVLLADGHFFTTRFGEPRQHPGVTRLNVLRNSYRMLIRELNLDIGEEDDGLPIFRAPRVKENARG